jgi:aspartokinase
VGTVVVSQVEVVNNCCILAAVGQRMASTPGVSATLFTALAKVRVNALVGNLVCCSMIN